MSAIEEEEQRAQQLRLYDRLTEVSARALFEVAGPGGSRLEFWQVGEAVVIIQFYRQGGGRFMPPFPPAS